MLTRRIARSDVVAETESEYNAVVDYEYRDAEYEYEHDEEKPEQSRAPKDDLHGVTNRKSSSVLSDGKRYLR